MKNILIIGARGFGREVYDLVCDCIASGAEYTVKGFLDDDKNALNGYEGYPPIISSVEDYEICKDDVFVCALGSPDSKQVYVNKILAKGGTFETIVSPYAIIRRNATIGKGCIITAGSNISVDTFIGDYVSVLSSAIGHDASVGDYVVLSGGCRINGYVQVGDMVYLGCGAMVHPHKKIGENAFVGMGSVVISNVKPSSKVFGNPARKVLV